MPSDRRITRSRSLRRKVATRDVKKTLLVFCEGEKTEPEYLRALSRKSSVRDLACVDIRFESGPGGSVPQTLVSKAVEARDRAVDEADEIDEFWCVFDVEWPRNHPNLKSVIQQARDNHIKLAVSNPCFELWLILHFQDQAAWLDTADALVVRRDLDGSKGKGIAVAKYMPHSGEAARRAAELDKLHERNGTCFPDNNPSSGMYRLIRSVEALES